MSVGVIDFGVDGNGESVGDSRSVLTTEAVVANCTKECWIMYTVQRI